MATIYQRCPKCDREVPVTVGQTWQYAGLRWSMSCLCPFCGAGYEADGRGIPPQDIRAAILTEEGEWQLQVPDATAPKTCIAKSLRNELNLSLTQAAQLIHQIPGVLATGTNAEMEWLAQRILAECAYVCAVVRRIEKSPIV